MSVDAPWDMHTGYKSDHKDIKLHVRHRCQQKYLIQQSAMLEQSTVFGRIH